MGGSEACHGLAFIVDLTTAGAALQTTAMLLIAFSLLRAMRILRSTR